MPIKIIDFYEKGKNKRNDTIVFFSYNCSKIFAVNGAKWIGMRITVNNSFKKKKPKAQNESL